jgi:DNA-binding transcriptional MerR regulator
VSDLTIKEVAAKAGVTPRTVHFYIQQGLLPPPEGGGRGARYSDAHLARLKLIRRLQAEHLPLNEIRRQLASMTDQQVEKALTGVKARERDSALDYIRSVTSRSAHGSRSPQMARPTLDAVTELRSSSPGHVSPRQSQWDRIVLNEDLELHIRRPLSRERNRFVDKLLAFARHLVEEEPS